MTTCTAYGLTFASLLEQRRYLVLRSDAERGDLAELEPQPAFDITPPGQRRRRYTADFRYLDLAQDPPVYVVEEVKPRQRKAWSNRGAWRLRLDLAASRYPTHQGRPQRFVVVEL